MTEGLFSVDPPQAPFGAEILDNMARVTRWIRAHERMVVCENVTAAEAIRRILEHHGVAGLYEVTVSPFIPPGMAVVMDRHPVRDFADEFPDRWTWSAREAEDRPL